MKTTTWTLLNNQQCQFGYRDSLFKSFEPERYLITSIILKLNKEFSPKLGYAGLEEHLSRAGVKRATAADVYHAVIDLRQSKLPDPSVTGNAGSFFKNPVLSSDLVDSLRSKFPALPAWSVDKTSMKISAAWMVEQCDLKGAVHKGAAVSPLHALVLVNQDGATGQAIWELAQQVQNAVVNRFGILLEPEPHIYRFPEFST